jgi:hypothetical protein
VKSYMTQYVAYLQPNFTIRDLVVKADLLTLGADYVPSDSDDAYAASFLSLASKFALTYPDDPWFLDNLPVLRNIAQYNILNQIKPNGLVRVFQNGVSAYFPKTRPDGSRYIFSQFGYQMDNVCVWGGLATFVEALLAKQLDGEAETYRVVRDNLRDAIHTQLWDSQANAWKWVDDPSGATSAHYYPHLMCQYFPELYGMPHALGEAETLRRYDGRPQVQLVANGRMGSDS